jgi:P-type conjugative transfer protein TrbG
MKVLLSILLLAAACSAQQAPKPSDYQQAAAIMSQPTTPAAPSAKKVPARHKAPLITGDITASKIQVQRQAPLPTSARMALLMSNDWLQGGPAPTQDATGRVLYAYGHGVPTVVCAVLQVCELDLELGEVPAKDALDLADNRFAVAEREAGSGPTGFTYLVLKPKEAGLDTTMTIGTNKRSYYVRLVSTEHEHMARVAFSYPEEEAARKAALAAAAEAERQRIAKASEVKAETAPPVHNWDYIVKLHGKDAEYLRPLHISDDGVHTHIVLSDAARHRGLPVIQLRDARGPIPANIRWDENELIVDAIFEHACLLEGVGRKQQRACIDNRGLHGQQHN